MKYRSYDDETTWFEDLIDEVLWHIWHRWRS